MGPLSWKSSLKARHFQLWSPIHLFACIFCWKNIAFASSFLWLVKQISKKSAPQRLPLRIYSSSRESGKGRISSYVLSARRLQHAVLLWVGCFPCLRYPEGLGCFVCPGDKNRYLDVTITIAFVCIVLNPWESKAAEFATHVVRCRSGLKIFKLYLCLKNCDPKIQCFMKIRDYSIMFFGSLILGPKNEMTFPKRLPWSIEEMWWLGRWA